MDRPGIYRSFAEFYLAGFNEGFVLAGHDGPDNITLAIGAHASAI